MLYVFYSRLDIVVVRTRGLRSSHLAGAGLLTLAFGAYQFASHSGSISNLPSGDQSLSTELSNPNGGAPSPLGREFQPAQPYPTTGMAGTPVLPPPGALVSFSNGGGTRETSPNYSNSNLDFAPQQNATSQGDTQVFFSPKGGCTTAIVNELNRAQRQILIQAYSFTSEPIAAASVAAHNRGVQVCVLLDKSQETEQYSAADFLDNSGIQTLIDAQHAIAHNKVILIDGVTLITGSFNFTTNAEQSNAENLLIIHNRPDLYSAYETNFQHHFEHCKKYVGRGTTGNPAAQKTHRQTGR
jgi:phosphatidylserine/phosphatidylglycerophosphate/cardiolipin synthase-like enzyme